MSNPFSSVDLKRPPLSPQTPLEEALNLGLSDQVKKELSSLSAMPLRASPEILSAQNDLLLRSLRELPFISGALETGTPLGRAAATEAQKLVNYEFAPPPGLSLRLGDMEKRARNVALEQFGPGFESSTGGQVILQSDARTRNEALENYRTQNLGLLSNIAASERAGAQGQYLTALQAATTGANVASATQGISDAQTADRLRRLGSAEPILSRLQNERVRSDDLAQSSAVQQALIDANRKGAIAQLLGLGAGSLLLGGKDTVAGKIGSGLLSLGGGTLASILGKGFTTQNIKDAAAPIATQSELGSAVPFGLSSAEGLTPEMAAIAAGVDTTSYPAVTSSITGIPGAVDLAGDFGIYDVGGSVLSNAALPGALAESTYMAGLEGLGTATAAEAGAVSILPALGIAGAVAGAGYLAYRLLSEGNDDPWYGKNMSGPIREQITNVGQGWLQARGLPDIPYPGDAGGQTLTGRAVNEYFAMMGSDNMGQFETWMTGGGLEGLMADIARRAGLPADVAQPARINPSAITQLQASTPMVGSVFSPADEYSQSGD